MGQAHKLVIVLCILSQTTDGNCHTILQVPVQLRLGPVIFLEVMEELLRRRGQLQFLGYAGKCLPALEDLLLGGLVFKGNKYSSSVAILYRHTETLGGDGGCRRLDDLIVFDGAPYLQRLLLGLFFLTANVGNQVIHHFRPGLEGLAVNVTGGNISIVASDDAINAAGGTDNSGNNNPGGWNQGGMGSSGGELNISGGYIWFKSGGDGIDSNGSITLSGGTVVDNGPTSNGDSPVDADGTVTYSGTRIMALGSTGMMSEGYGSSGTYVASTGLNASEGTLVVVTDSDNNVLGAYTTTQQSAGIIFSSPEIVNGATAKIYTGGTLTGATAVGEDGFYTGGTYSGGTEVSTSSSGGNQGGPGGWGGF